MNEILFYFKYPLSGLLEYVSLSWRDNTNCKGVVHCRTYATSDITFRRLPCCTQQKPVQMPEVLQNLLVGRIVVKTEAGVEIEGEVSEIL